MSLTQTSYCLLTVAACSVSLRRRSSDAGKGNKSFIEVSYKLPTEKWLTDDAIEKVAEREQCNGNEAIKVILKKEVLPIARDVMAHFIEVIRENTKDAAII